MRTHNARKNRTRFAELVPNRANYH